MVHSKKHERSCRLCQTKYNYCPICDDYKSEPMWKVAFCSENCKDIDEILSNWGAKVADSETTATLLAGKDVSRKEFWNDSFRGAYEQVMKDTAPKAQLSVSEELKKEAEEEAVAKAEAKVQHKERKAAKGQQQPKEDEKK